MTITQATAQDLGAYQWKNRIILLKENNLDSDWLRAQLKRLQSEANELQERDLLVFILTDGAVYDSTKNMTELNAQKIIENYDLKNFQGLVLIGKDGRTKLKEAFVVHSKTILELIDDMPMRKSETEKGL